MMKPFHSGLGPITFFEESKAVNGVGVLVVAARGSQLWLYRCTYEQWGEQWRLAKRVAVEPWLLRGAK